MDAGLRALLDELHEWGREHDERQRRHLDRLRNLEPGTHARLGARAQLRAHAPPRDRHLQRVLDYLAALVAGLDRGWLISIELDPDRQRLADENLRRAGEREHVDLVLGDAAAVVGD